MFARLSTKCPVCLRSTTKYFASAAVASKQEKTSKVGKPDQTGKQGEYDLVSPPDPDSNIRKIVYHKSKQPSQVEEDLIRENNHTYEWNNHFWKEHNQIFFQEKKKYLERENVVSGSSKEVSDKLSLFYKDFLEKNHDVYMKYNREWYQRNFKLLWMSIRTSLNKLFPKSKT